MTKAIPLYQAGEFGIGTQPIRASATGRGWQVAVLGCLFAAVSALYASRLADNPDYWPAIGIGCGFAALGVIGVMRRSGLAWHSAAVVYIGFVWLFHFPMTLLLNLFPGLWTRLSPQIYGWTQCSSWYRASLYALLCVIAFAGGCACASTSRRRIAWEPQADTLRFSVGVATAFGGLTWLYYLLTRAGGLNLFGSGYAQVFNLLDSAFSTAVFAVSVGCLLALASAPRRWVWLPWVVQLAASLPVLLTGSRQFALIGPLVLAALAARRGIRLGLAGTAIGCIVMLWVISYVGEARSHGMAEGLVREGAVNPVGALVEMGSSLETTSMAIDWIDNGDSYLLGGSYWLPFERGLGLVLPLRKDLATDARAMNMLLVSRVSGLGGSAVAESYYNFSAFGAFFFLGLGILLTRLDLAGIRSSSVLGVFLYTFLFQARNWFISVPRFLLLGLLPIALCICVEAIRRRARPYGGVQ